MAEIKNTFLRSKMNQDLDDRLIPKGEYRRAVNVSIGKSEDSDVGALENIIGNNKAADSKPYSDSFDIIGYYSDDTRTIELLLLLLTIQTLTHQPLPL